MTTVAVLGDSITYESRAELRAALSALPATTITALVGRNGKTFAELQDDADVVAATKPHLVVINLGTNDALKHVDTGATLTELDVMYAKFPESRIVAVAVTTRFSGSPFDVRAEAINAHLRAGQRERGVPVAVVAWDQIVAADASHESDGPILSDGLHPTPRGRARLAQVVAAAVAGAAP